MIFNKKYFLVFILLLIVEILIALFLKSGFIRHTFGDFLVVIMLYALIKSLIKTNTIIVAVTVLVIAYVIEFLQLTAFLDVLNLRSSNLATTILGSHFSAGDLIAYSLGVICAVFIDDKVTLRFVK